ncbi:unnamed protein product [Rotaria sordida]|nr:unnamed protein product [Rotaria sordida]
MNEVIPIASLYADEHIPDELYVLVRDNLIDQLDARLYNLTNPTQYLISVNWHGKEKLSLLMVAALNGYDEIVRILLAHCQSQRHVELEGRVAISEEDIIDGMTAIQCACYRSHFIVAKTLIEIGGADVHHDNKKWPCYPLLIQAGAENRLEIILEQQITKYEERILIFRWVSKLCRENLAISNGKTLLHLCVDNETNNPLNWRRIDTLPHIR